MASVSALNTAVRKALKPIPTIIIPIYYPGIIPHIPVNVLLMDAINAPNIRSMVKHIGQEISYSTSLAKNGKHKVSNAIIP